MPVGYWLKAPWADRFNPWPGRQLPRLFSVPHKRIGEGGPKQHRLSPFTRVTQVRILPGATRSRRLAAQDTYTPVCTTRPPFPNHTNDGGGPDACRLSFG